MSYITPDQITDAIYAATLSDEEIGVQYHAKPHEYKDLFVQMRLFLLQIFNYPTILKELDHFFKAFKNQYFADIIIPDPQFPHFANQTNRNPCWYYSHRKGLPNAFPVPDEYDMSVVSAIKTESLLLQFFVYMLKRFGILSEKIMLDTSILYLPGVVEPALLETFMKQGKLFVDNGPASIVHGKYSHLLQLCLLALAMKRGLFKGYNEEILPDLINILVDRQYMRDASVKGQIHGWDYVLDLIIQHQLSGAAGINLFMLSPIAREYCPALQQFWARHYGNLLRKFPKGDTLQNTVEQVTEIFSVVDTKYNTSYYDTWGTEGKAYQLTWVDNDSSGMYSKHKRPAIFYHRESAQIMDILDGNELV